MGPDDLCKDKKYRFQFKSTTGEPCIVEGVYLRSDIEHSTIWFWFRVTRFNDNTDNRVIEVPYAYQDLGSLELME